MTDEKDLMAFTWLKCKVAEAEPTYVASLSDLQWKHCRGIKEPDGCSGDGTRAISVRLLVPNGHTARALEQISTNDRAGTHWRPGLHRPAFGNVLMVGFGGKNKPWVEGGENM